jgi:hypothetical protein
MNTVEVVSQIAYWRKLIPEACIEGTGKCEWSGDIPLRDATYRAAVASYRSSGFLALASVLSPSRVATVRDTIERLRDAGWPAVWAYIYDDLWHVGRAPILRTLLLELLGAEVRLMPRIWAHYVAASRGNSGWRPHVDMGDDGRPAVSLWVPLSSAKVTNGCMYLVKRDPRIPETVGKARERAELSMNDVIDILENVRALPAEPGDILCWDESTLHWGADYEGGDAPRVSFALEFTAVSSDGKADEGLLDPLAAMPDFASRLRLIADSILTYQRFEPAAERMAPLANQILGR